MIAREWEFLVPVRAFCELHGIPAQMGDEEIPGFWYLRETQALIEWLRGRQPRIVDTTTQRDRLDDEAPGPWNDLLRQAVDEHALETGGGETPVDHFIEWLAEWGRDIRRRQRGLLLLTAHRAKGLEFDHVAVLDGGWDRKRRGDDPDEARRLYYVAMTRARETLALARFEGSHKLQDALHGNHGVIRREPVELQSGSMALEYRFVRPSLKDVDLGFAGRRRRQNAVHRAIAALSPGDPLLTRITEPGRWELLDRAGTVVGRLAKSFEPPPRMGCRSAEVLAVVGCPRSLRPAVP